VFDSAAVSDRVPEGAVTKCGVHAAKDQLAACRDDAVDAVSADQ